MFGKNKKKDVEVVGKKEGERQKNISEPKYKIIVYKTLGKDVYQEIDNFYASQKRDASGSMFLVNDDHNFKESLAISQNESVLKLKERLELKDLDYKEQLKAVNSKIDEQEKRIRSIVDGEVVSDSGKKIKVNAIEEQKLLRQLKVLNYIIRHSNTGSYDSIDGQGFRQRFYLYDEGALIPMFWDRKTTSLYVAVDTAIKFYKADQDLINQDYADENRDKWARIGRGLMMVLFVLLFIGNMYMFLQNLDRSNELDGRSTAMATAIEESNFGQCIGIIADTNEDLRDIIMEYRAENNKTSTNNINVVNTNLE